MPGMRHRLSGRDCPCCTQWAPTRASEKREWQRLEWQQADPPMQWTGAARCPQVFAEHDPEDLFFGYWAALREDDRFLTV